MLFPDHEKFFCILFSGSHKYQKVFRSRLQPYYIIYDPTTIGKKFTFKHQNTPTNCFSRKHLEERDRKLDNTHGGRSYKKNIGPIEFFYEEFFRTVCKRADVTYYSFFVALNCIPILKHVYFIIFPAKVQQKYRISALEHITRVYWMTIDGHHYIINFLLQILLLGLYTRIL